MSEAWSKNTGVKITVGTVIAMVLAGVALDRRFGVLEANWAHWVPFIERTRDRQDIYIERRDAQHQSQEEKIQELERTIKDEHDRHREEYHELCAAIAAHIGEALCD